MKKRIFSSLILIIAGFLIYNSWSTQPEENDNFLIAGFEMPDDPFDLEEESRLIQAIRQNELYGFVVDSFEHIEQRVQPNQSLSKILNPYGVNFLTIDRIVQASEGIYDLRKIRSGDKYTLFCTQDDEEVKAHYMVYQASKTDFIVFDLSDNEPQVYKRQKEVEIVEREVSGIITSSLYESLLSQGMPLALVDKMVDVYAWQIDFFRIQKNDHYRLVYRETQVDGEPIGVDKIIAAQFNHFGNDFYAFHYDQGKGIDYFDEEGNSLHKAFLKAPLNFTRISSRFTQKRFHPVQKRYKAHLGTDYAAPTGTPIRTVGDGIVTEARYSKYNGNYVKIKHNGTYATQYLHMSKIGKGMKPGTKVKQGDIIGYVGATGLATGPHLCFRFWKNGQQVDPFKQDIPPSEPISEENLAEYNELKEKLLRRLEQITIPFSQQEDEQQLALQS
ncbi:MAG: peptidoglycan DD-metalloendopeptidase family protein [Cyclobacteriaceae bacterium]|nr:peptidoglycan DD-metalloendopeptidase family protein [Cyclobacteriaceae bacterium]MCH8517322.1 peptidoglycan DD-metalloendopeptidase family protein [Cyclobacteriaceae bacterium]